MLGIPTDFTVDQIDTLTSLSIPDTIRTDEEIDSLADDIKKLKKLQTTLKSEKKEAEAPSEAARKKADAELKVARDEKKRMGEPFKVALDWLASTEKKLRGLIVDYQTEKEMEKQRELARIKQLEEEAERKRLEAEAAKVAARKTGRKEDMVAAYQAQQEADDVENDLAVTEQNQTQTPESLNTSTAKRVDFEVTDILQVPEEYVEYVPYEEKIHAQIKQQFPFLLNLRYEIDEDNVPDELMCDTPIKQKIIADLRDGKEIPGIKKITKESLIVR